MDNQKSSPIPIPPRQHLREFQVIYLPVVTFLLLLVVIGWMWLRYVAPATIVVMIFTFGKSRVPAFLGQNYDRERRTL